MGALDGPWLNLHVDDATFMTGPEAALSLAYNPQGQ